MKILTRNTKDIKSKHRKKVFEVISSDESGYIVKYRDSKISIWRGFVQKEINEPTKFESTDMDLKQKRDKIELDIRKNQKAFLKKHAAYKEGYSFKPVGRRLNWTIVSSYISYGKKGAMSVSYQCRQAHKYTGYFTQEEIDKAVK